VYQVREMVTGAVPILVVWTSRRRAGRSHGGEHLQDMAGGGTATARCRMVAESTMSTWERATRVAQVADVEAGACQQGTRSSE